MASCFQERLAATTYVCRKLLCLLWCYLGDSGLFTKCPDEWNTLIQEDGDCFTQSPASGCRGAADELRAFPLLVTDTRASCN